MPQLRNEANRHQSLKWIGAIVGWPLPEARDLLRELTEHATRREFVHAHRWRQNDLVIKSTVRDLRRTTTLDDGPKVEQGGDSLACPGCA